jgi:hypothetical protein
MNLEQKGYEGVNGFIWFRMVGQRLVFVNTVISLRVPKYTGKFLTILATSFSIFTPPCFFFVML